MPTIGRYEIQAEIGRGAMGVVYKAHDPQLLRQVAVKTYSLPEGISAELATEFHQRFLREARAAASLSHPGIVTVYDAGEDPRLKVPFIAMEYVPGQSLKQRLEKDPLDPSWVISFGAILADALNVAHRAGIVHRDIKPANILVREADSAAKLADFGVAHLASSDLTRSGASVGSPGYMSPEQVRGFALDGRSDLFSLAVVLYEALCGKRPFRGDDIVSLAYSIAHDTQIPLSQQLRHCPAGLDEFFNRALDKDPGRRYVDGTAFREAFLAAGARHAAINIDRTVVDASTIRMEPIASPGSVARIEVSAPPTSVSRRIRPARFMGLTMALAALLGIGLAAAGYMRLGGEPSRDVAPDPQLAAAPHEATPPPVTPPPRSTPPPQVEAPRSTPPRAVPAAAHPSSPRSVPISISAGTALHLTLDDPVGSSVSQPGDRLTARLTEPVMGGDRLAIPAGSILHGRVTEATPATKGLGDKAGSLSLTFDRIVTPSGQTIPMSASLTTIAPKSSKRTAATVGGSAAGGALLGKVLGGKTKDAAIGAVAGAAVGTGIAAATKGQDVSFAAGSSLAITLDQPLTLNVRP